MARYEAIGLIETFGLVFALEAADAMCKVGACKTAVDAGVKVVKEMEDGNLYSSVVIARPHQDLEKIIERYAIKNLIPEQN